MTLMITIFSQLRFGKSYQFEFGCLQFVKIGRPHDESEIASGRVNADMKQITHCYKWSEGKHTLTLTRTENERGTTKRSYFKSCNI